MVIQLSAAEVESALIDYAADKLSSTKVDSMSNVYIKIKNDAYLVDDPVNDICVDIEIEDN